MDYDHPWTLNTRPVTDETVEGFSAFVYLITNLTNGKKYVGKKRLQFIRTRSIKKKKKRVRVPSDWKEYWGSNKSLQEDIENLGVHNFKREILRLCKTLGESSYYEARYQFQWDVLLSDQFYNDWIQVKVTRAHLPKCIS